MDDSLVVEVVYVRAVPFEIREENEAVPFVQIFEEDALGFVILSRQQVVDPLN